MNDSFRFVPRINPEENPAPGKQFYSDGFDIASPMSCSPYPERCLRTDQIFHGNTKEDVEDQLRQWLSHHYGAFFHFFSC